nr:zinc finger, CCHC-type [Tanacetum cinerariifolium]
MQALTNLHYLFSGFMDYFWSRELNISNFGPANRDEMCGFSKAIDNDPDCVMSAYFLGSFVTKSIVIFSHFHIGIFGCTANLQGARATGAAPGIKLIWNSTWRIGGRSGRSSGKTFGNSLTTVIDAIIGVVVVISGVPSIIKLSFVIIGVPVGSVFLLGLLILAIVTACASRAAATSFLMAAGVMTGAADVDVAATLSATSFPIEISCNPGIDKGRNTLYRKCTFTRYNIEEDPKTYDKAMQYRDVCFLKEAIDDEIGCKWIFKRKMKVDGTIDKFKARLVIQGFRQKEGIDYLDTYAPVARITTIRLLLALAAIHNPVIHQMDVKTAFLNGDLDEEVSGKGVIICLYVDDMLIFGTDQNQVDKTKKNLSSKFSMKDMREANVILDCSPVSTPMDPVEKLKPNTMDQVKYFRDIGRLMYAMTSTRPDIAYAVGRLSRFTSNPSRQHWQAIIKVFKYLKGTLNYGLSYVGYPSVLEAYSDASWINHVEDSSFTSGWVFLLGGGAISWASKKQTCITEFEFVALVAAGKEAEWLRNLVHEILIWPKPIAPYLSDVIVLQKWLKHIVTCLMASPNT